MASSDVWLYGASQRRAALIDAGIRVTLFKSLAQANKMGLSAVISVCCKKDIETWRRAAPEILRRIKSASYILIVPDGEIDDFRDCSPPQFLVKPETAYVGDIKLLILDHIPERNHHRVGWNLQQIVKIAAAKSIDGENVLVWDADTIPLKPLNFILDDGRLVFYTGKEHHAPYFATVNRLLGLNKLADFSFIAQCLPLKVSWLTELCEEIERRHGLPWMQAIIYSIDPVKSSSFSEYETLGTYFLQNCSEAVKTTDARWLRCGSALLGKASELSDMDLQSLSFAYDYISFEAWDKPRRRRNKVFLSICRLPILRFLLVASNETCTSFLRRAA